MIVREADVTRRVIRRAGLLLLAWAAAACSLAPTSGGTEAGLKGSAEGSGDSEYILMRPRDYEPERVYPLLVALHGFGGDAKDMARAFESYAGLPVLIAVPQGEYARPRGGFSWFLVTRDRSQWPRTDERSVSRVVRCIAAVKARERVGKVVVFGFSQGASLAYLTGLRNPGLVDGIAAVAGSLPPVDEEGAILGQDQIGRARRVAVFIARGTDDPLIDAQSFARQKDFFGSHGYRIEALSFEGVHQLTLPLLTRMWSWMERSVRPRD